MQRIAIIIIVSLFMTSSLVFAETTTFKQQILPIDCIYEVIDVGTQKLRYITPETCPIDPGPPIVTEPLNPVDNTSNGTRTVWRISPEVNITDTNITADTSQSNNVPSTKAVQGRVERILDRIVRNNDLLYGIVILSSLTALLLIARHKRDDSSSD